MAGVIVALVGLGAVLGDLPAGRVVAWFAVIMGIGNGFGNGVIMTLGADVAPAATRAEFLAAWRLTHDFGMFLGPLAAGAAATVVALGVALAALGVVSVTGAGLMFRYIPRFVPVPGRSTPDLVAR